MHVSFHASLRRHRYCGSGRSPRVVRLLRIDTGRLYFRYASFLLYHIARLAASPPFARAAMYTGRYTGDEAFITLRFGVSSFSFGLISFFRSWNSDEFEIILRYTRLSRCVIYFFPDRNLQFLSRSCFNKRKVGV